MPEGPTHAERPFPDIPRPSAVSATGLSFTLTDPRQVDNPMVWVNPAFSRVTGYPPEEALGRNCRFLQTEATDPVAVEQLRRGVDDGRSVAVTLLNRRRDGRLFWNHLTVDPVFDATGELVHFVGVQVDVTEQVRLNAEHEQALEAERRARDEAEGARARLSALVDATTQLAATLDLEEAMDRLATIAVPRMADWVAINLVDTHGKLYSTRVRHRDGLPDVVSQFVDLQPRSLTSRSGVYRLIAGEQPFLLAETSPEAVSSHFTNPEMVSVLAALGIGSLMFVPLKSRLDRIVGTMILVSTPAGRTFTAEDLHEAADLGRRAGLTIDNARLYEREHWAAETLQRSLLPDLPAVPGITIAARYLPGEATADVGGDFYDILQLPDGSIGFAIGDVVGHDLAAAAAMGHLRGLLRACAWDDAASGGEANPGRVLSRVDGMVQGLDVVPLATLLYGRLQLPTTPGGPARFRYANAGHPSPLLRLPTGEVRRLTAGAGVLLGVTDLGPHPMGETVVPPGSMLIGYTDGLVEHRGVDIEEGIGALIATTATIPPGTGPEGIVARLLQSVSAERDDDVALLVLRVDG